MPLESHNPPESGISQGDWEKTPPSVKRFLESLLIHHQALVERFDAMEQRVATLERENQQLREENERLREQVGRDSRNSSMPPSSDGPGARLRRKKTPTGKQRGGQKGHAGHERELVAPERVDERIDHVPTTCKGCGEALSGEDPDPYRHQVVEVPPIHPIVQEHRLHALVCPSCGVKTRACLPADVSRKGYGPGAAALTALMRSFMRQSARRTREAMGAIFDVRMSTGTVVALCEEISQATAPSVEEAGEFLRHQGVVNADETPFAQGDADGANPDKRKGWLWVGVTPLVAVFVLALSRGHEVATQLLGESFGGILGSDRAGAYRWVDAWRRQVCWAHLLRDFQKFIDRGGASKQIGDELMKAGYELFGYWHRVRDGTLERSSFRKYLGPIRQRVCEALERGARYPATDGDASPRAKTARTCRELLTVEAALWTFARVEGVEPTNNVSERSLRFAVIWRRICFGTQSAAGSLFVARMLTVIETSRLQGRDVLEFLTHSCRAARVKSPGPSLLPASVAIRGATGTDGA